MRIILILALLLSSCGQAKMVYTWPAKIQVLSQMPPEISFMIISGIQSLNNALPEKAVSFQKPNTIFPYQIAVRYSTQERGGMAGLAEVYDDLCVITVYPIAVRNNLVKTAIWHEIAHCVGVMHKSTNYDIMSTHIRPFNEYKEEHLNTFFKDFKDFYDRVKY